jgi:PAS domain S-box-containing protein
MLQANPEALPFGIATVISLLLACFAYRRRSTPAAIVFSVAMFGEAAWALFEALELVITDLPAKKLCFALRTAGTMTTVLGLLATVLVYTGRVSWLTPRRFGALVAPVVVLTALAWTNEWHHLFWRDIWNKKIGAFWIAMPEYGPGFWVLFTYGYVLAAITTLLLVQAVTRSAGIFRWQASIMLFGVMVPWVVNIIDMGQVFGFIHVDTAAAAFAITGMAFFLALFRFRLLDLTPVAQAVVFQSMQDPVVVIDLRGRIVDCNPAAERLAGKKAQEVLGVEAACAFGDWPALAGRLDRIKSHGEGSFELAGPGAASSSTYDARISRLGGKARPSGWVLVLRDVTGLKRGEAERVRLLREQAARTEAEAANQAKDRFLATLSHELRTPLTPILASVTAILDQPATAGPIRSVLEMIRRNVMLQVRLIDDLLDLARIRGGKLNLNREVINAHELIHRVVEICQDDIRAAGLELILDLAATEHHIDADPVRMQQVLWNLIKNAIKFTPSNGTLTIRTRDRIEVDSGGGEIDLVVEVSDTGIGIAPGVLPRIFDIFEQGGVTSTRKYGGLGLGLTISRSLVEQNGGRLVAASEGEGQGTTISLEMPTVPALVPVVEPCSPAAVDRRRPLRILLVDDNQDTLNYLSTMLTTCGYSIRGATSLAEALRVIAEAEFDLLISDIELPDGSGWQLIPALRAKRRVPGIALSGFGSSDDIELSLSAGFDVHMTKPVEFRKLEEVILRLTSSPPAETLVRG